MFTLVSPKRPGLAAYVAPGGAAVTYDAGSTGAYAGATTSYSFSHTQGALTNGYVVIALVGWQSGGTPPSPSVITYDGAVVTAMANHVDTANGNGVRLLGRALGSKAAGTYTVSVTFPLAISEMRGGAMTFNNVHQTVPTDGPNAQANATGTALSLTHASATDQIVIESHVNWGPTTWTSGSGQTTTWDGSASSTGGAGSREDGAASVTMSGTIGTSSPWDMIAISLRPTGGPFWPSDISGLVMWLRSDSGVLELDGTTPEDAESASDWIDQSTASHSVWNSITAQQPIYKTAIVNGKPVVRFDGTNDVYGNLSLTVGTSHTFFVVFNRSTGSGYAVILFASSPLGNGYYLNAGKLDLYFTTDHSNTTTMTNGTWYVATCSVSSGAISFFRNGTADGTPAGSAPSMTFNNVGGPPSGTTEFFPGDIAEIIIYDNALSVANRQAVEDYLGARYGITITH